jgi:hypothetical protein
VLAQLSKDTPILSAEALTRLPGYLAVTEAGSGMEALEVLRMHPPNAFSLILTVRSLQLHMPFLRCVRLAGAY